MTVVKSTVAVLDSEGLPAEGRIVRAYRRADGVLVGASTTAESTPRPVVSASWNSTYSDNGWMGYLLRTVIATEHVRQAGKVRIGLTGGAGEGLAVASVFVGEHDASTLYGMRGPVCPVLFGGLASATVTASTILLSDWVDCAVNSESGIVVSVYFTDGANDNAAAITPAPDGWKCYIASGQPQANSAQSNPPGLTVSTQGYVVSRIEMKDVELDIGNYSINCGTETGEVTVICMDDTAGSILPDLAARATPA